MTPDNEILHRLDREMGVLVTRVDEIRANQRLIIDRQERTDRDIAEFKKIHNFSRGVHWVLVSIIAFIAFMFQEFKGLIIK